MTTRITHNSVGMVMVAGVFIGLCFNECFGSETCKNNSGSTKHVCVAWDRETAPEEGADFTVAYSCEGCSDDPAVALLVGDDHWVVWSEVISTGAAANIGALTTPGDDDNYGVKIANGANAGAANVASMVLMPSGDHSSSIATGSRISGNLTGNLTLKETTGGSGGDLSLTIDGDADGDITVPTVSSLSIGGSNFGTIDVWELSGSLTITNEVRAPVYITLGGSGTITAGTVKHSIKLAQGGSFEGTATFAGVDLGGTVITCGAAIGGEIHVTGNVAGTVGASNYTGQPGLEDGALIDIDGDLSGYVYVNYHAVGDIEIAGNITSTGKVLVYGAISGDVTVDSDVDGEILASWLGTGDITGLVTIEGEFNGNICADNLSPMEDLPEEHVSIDTFGDDWTICGGVLGCGDGTISSSDPADGTQDSRQPHPPGDCSMSARQGIGSEDEPIEITLTESGANSVKCWELCETDIEDVDTGQGCSTLSANDIKSVTETSTGVYEIELERPISAGEWTTITYLGDDSYVTYASLPADANADEYAGSSDITALINYLNEVAEPPYGDYSCDMDHSTACGPPDILRLIDLLNGTSKFISWNNEELPSNTCP